MGRLTLANDGVEVDAFFYISINARAKRNEFTFGTKIINNLFTKAY